MNKKEFFKYIIALLLFGSNGIVASFIDLNSQNIVLLRTLIGSVFLIAVFFISGGKMTFYKHRKELLFIAASGVAMGTSWMFLYEAYARIGVSIASLLYYCGPIIVVVLSPLIFKEKLTVYKIVGFSTALVGVVFINGNIFNYKGDMLGVVFGLFSAIMYAFMVICNKKAKNIVGLENSTLQLTTAFLIVAVFVGLKQGYAMEISPKSILPIFILGLLNTGLGCYFYFSSIGKLKVQTVAICGYLEPLSAVVFSLIVLKETMTAVEILGVILIVGGAMTTELLDRKKI